MCTGDQACSRLTSAQTLAPALSLPVIDESIEPILAKLVSDQIPNIRFNVAKSYGVLIDVLKRLPDSTSTVYEMDQQGKTGTGCAKGQEIIQSRILPNLQKLMSDDDVDVRFFAGQAAKGYEDAMET